MGKPLGRPKEMMTSPLIRMVSSALLVTGLATVSGMAQTPPPNPPVSNPTAGPSLTPAPVPSVPPATPSTGGATIPPEEIAPPDKGAATQTDSGPPNATPFSGPPTSLIPGAGRN